MTKVIINLTVTQQGAIEKGVESFTDVYNYHADVVKKLFDGEPIRSFYYSENNKNYLIDVTPFPRKKSLQPTEIGHGFSHYGGIVSSMTGLRVK